MASVSQAQSNATLRHQQWLPGQGPTEDPSGAPSAPEAHAAQSGGLGRGAVLGPAGLPPASHPVLPWGSQRVAQGFLHTCYSGSLLSPGLPSRRVLGGGGESTWRKVPRLCPQPPRHTHIGVLSSVVPHGRFRSVNILTAQLLAS